MLWYFMALLCFLNNCSPMPQYPLHMQNFLTSLLLQDIPIYRVIVWCNWINFVL